MTNDQLGDPLRAAYPKMYLLLRSTQLLAVLTLVGCGAARLIFWGTMPIRYPYGEIGGVPGIMGCLGVIILGLSGFLSLFCAKVQWAPATAWILRWSGIVAVAACFAFGERLR